MQALVIRISRDVYVLDNTVNFMLNKRKSKKAAGASPQTPLGELSALPPTPLAVTGGGAPPPVPSPSFEYIYQTPPFPKSWIRPCLPSYVLTHHMCSPIICALPSYVLSHHMCSPIIGAHPSYVLTHHTCSHNVRCQ